MAILNMGYLLDVEFLEAEHMDPGHLNVTKRLTEGHYAVALV